jgi:hypothetical protein
MEKIGSMLVRQLTKSAQSGMLGADNLIDGKHPVV